MGRLATMSSTIPARASRIPVPATTASPATPWPSSAGTTTSRPPGARAPGSSAIAGATDDQHVGISYNDFYTGNDTPDTGACNLGAVSFHNVMPNIYQQIYYSQPVRLDRSAVLRLRLQPFHRRPERIAQVGQLLYHRQQRQLHGQRLRAVPERRPQSVGVELLRHGVLRGLPHDRPAQPRARGARPGLLRRTANQQRPAGHRRRHLLPTTLGFRGQHDRATRPPLRRAKATSAPTGRVGPTFTAWTARTARTSPSTA